jgi:serine O-acetyltransferase
MSDAVWTSLQAEAELLASRDVALRPWIEALVLRHASMHRAVGALVAEALGIDRELSVGLADRLGAYAARQASAIAFDLRDARDRDQAATSLTTVLLFSKGFRGLVAYRLAHAAWNDGDETLARFIHWRHAGKYGSWSGRPSSEG